MTSINKINNYHETGGSDSLHLHQRIMASSAGGILTSLLMTPLDVVKTRLQAQTKPQSFNPGRCFLYCNGLMDHLCHCASQQSDVWYRRSSNLRFTSSTVCRNMHYLSSTSLRYSGSMDALLKIAKMEGPSALYAGLSATLIMALPSTVIYYTSMDLLKSQMGYNPPNSVAGKEWIPPVSAICGRVFAVLTVSPLEMIRTKMQSGNFSWSQITDIIMKEFKSGGGIASLFRGVSPTLLRDVPFSAIYWFTYDTLKTGSMLRNQSDHISVSEACVYGSTAGAIAGVVTLPFDVIKTHTQIEMGEVGNGDHRRGTLAAIKHLKEAKGYKALFSGLVPRLVKVIPASAVMIGSFEFLKNHFRTQNQQLMLS